jgi:hypothetical protein
MPKKKAKLVELEQKIDAAKRIVARQQAIKARDLPIWSRTGRLYRLDLDAR